MLKYYRGSPGKRTTHLIHFVVSRRSVSAHGHGYDQHSHIKPDHLSTNWLATGATSNLKHDRIQFFKTLHMRTLAR